MLTPRDDDNRSLNLVPSTKSLDTQELTITSTATNITLNSKTDLIEVQSDNADIYLKYWENCTTNTNGFDEKIKSWYIRHYVLPKNVTIISFICKTSWTITLIQK